MQINLIEITLRHGCSAVHLLHVFRTPFPKNTSGGLLLTDSTCHENKFRPHKSYYCLTFLLVKRNSICEIANTVCICKVIDT